MDVTKLSTNARKHQDSRVRIIRDQQRSGKLTVKQSSVVPWEVVGSQAVKKVLSHGYWAGLPRVVSPLRPIFLLKIQWHHWDVLNILASSHSDRTSFSERLQCPRHPSILLRSSRTLASLAKQWNQLLQSAIMLLLPFVRSHSSDHD